MGGGIMEGMGEGGPGEGVRGASIGPMDFSHEVDLKYTSRPMFFRLLYPLNHSLVVM
jgi:hypothetical protein